MNKRLFLFVALLALSCVSCGKGLYPVSGQVLYKGQPAAGAVVVFARQGGDATNEPLIMGIVADDGAFNLVCGSLGPGAQPGEYDVFIEWKQRPRRARGLTQNPPDRLKGRYANPQRPLLHATVKAETNHLPPFELTD